MISYPKSSPTLTLCLLTNIVNTCHTNFFQVVASIFPLMRITSIIFNVAFKLVKILMELRKVTISAKPHTIKILISVNVG
jgi:hypothetical protein